MTTLSEIEATVDTLPADKKRELFLFLATRLRADAAEPPPPRDIPGEKIRSWIAEDEAGYRTFRKDR
jgi:hypothetical protein